MWERREDELINVGKEIGLEEMGGYLGLDALLELKKDCIVAMTQRNDLFMIFAVIATCPPSRAAQARRAG